MKLDFNALAQRLLLGSETLVPQWLPGGRRRGHEWVCGDLSGGEGTSLSVNLLSGRWADFATSDRGGDLVDLYAAIHELTLGEAYRELDDGSTSEPPARPAKPTKPARTVVTPVPEAAADCECVHPLYGAPSARWTYWDGNGEVLGYVARYDPAGQRKQIVPWTWDGDRWGMGQWPVPRPLYRLQELEARSCGPDAHRRGRESRRRCGGDQRAVRRLHLARWRAGRQPGDWRARPRAQDPPVARRRRRGYRRQCSAWQRCWPSGAPRSRSSIRQGCPTGGTLRTRGFASWQDARAWIAPRTSVFARAPEPEPPKPTGPESEEHAQAQADSRSGRGRKPGGRQSGTSGSRSCVPDDGYLRHGAPQCVEYEPQGSFDALYRHDQLPQHPRQCIRRRALGSRRPACVRRKPRGDAGADARRA
jgi:hypothetical protein